MASSQAKASPSTLIDASEYFPKSCLSIDFPAFSFKMTGGCSPRTEKANPLASAANKGADKASSEKPVKKS